MQPFSLFHGNRDLAFVLAVFLVPEIEPEKKELSVDSC